MWLGFQPRTLLDRNLSPFTCKASILIEGTSLILNEGRKTCLRPWRRRSYAGEAKLSLSGTGGVHRSCSWRPFQNAGYYSCGGSWQSHRGHFSSKWLSGKRIYLPLMFASREGSIFLHPNYHLPPSLLQDILALLLEYLSWNYVKYFKMISVYTTLAAAITLYFPLYIFSVSNQSNLKKKSNPSNSESSTAHSNRLYPENSQSFKVSSFPMRRLT